MGDSPSEVKERYDQLSPILPIVKRQLWMTMKPESHGTSSGMKSIHSNMGVAHKELYNA